MQLDGKAAIITGAARGIGRAIATRYVREGAWVAIADINEAGAQAAAAELGSGAIGLHLDVTRQELDRRDDRGRGRAAFGGIDILVNNAALFDLAPIVEITRESYHRVFTVNVEGALFTLQAAARQMIAPGARRPDHQLRLAGRPPRRGTGGGVLRVEGGGDQHHPERRSGSVKHGINVNAIAPGVVDNEHWADVDARFARAENLPIGREEATGRRGSADRTDGAAGGDRRAGDVPGRPGCRLHRGADL